MCPICVSIASSLNRAYQMHNLSYVMECFRSQIIDSTGLMSRYSRQNRHNRRYLLRKCCQIGKQRATGLIVWDQPGTSRRFLETRALLRVSAQVPPMTGAGPTIHRSRIGSCPRLHSAGASRWSQPVESSTAALQECLVLRRYESATQEWVFPSRMPRRSEAQESGSLRCSAA